MFYNPYGAKLCQDIGYFFRGGGGTVRNKLIKKPVYPIYWLINSYFYLFWIFKFFFFPGIFTDISFEYCNISAIVDLANIYKLREFKHGRNLSSMWKRHCNYSFCAYSSYLNFIKGTRKTLLHEVWLYRSNSIVMFLFHSMQRLLIFLEFVTSIILLLLLKVYFFAIISFNPLFSFN